MYKSCMYGRNMLMHVYSFTARVGPGSELEDLGVCGGLSITILT